MTAIGASSTFTFTITGLEAATAVAQFEATEAIAQLFQVQLLLVSEDPDIAFDAVIGQPALFTLTTDGSEPRYLHGILSRFANGDSGKRLNAYRATLVPKVWRLHHRQDSRIFQGLSVPEILERVLQAAGIPASDFRFSLERPHAPREYCVQYRESDLAFISRLMEEEGIYYFFEHEETRHVMVMADGRAAVVPIAGPETLRYRSSLGSMAHGESVSRFVLAQEIKPGKVTLSDFNFKLPQLSLLGSSTGTADADLEVYEYPGDHETPTEASQLAQIRLEEKQASRQEGEGDSGCIRLIPGHTFTLEEHSRDSHNRSYLITRVRHRGAQAVMGEGATGNDESYLNSFQVIPSDVPYRPARRTPRPTVKGVQTAIVVGPSGEEIHTDEHGRVKVQFHWDRQGRRDDRSSCWMRVSQLWAGGAFGAMFIPRVGQEVVVDFIEGDPDRPIVVGGVYHRTNVPPYLLPAEKTKSTIKTNSTPGGSGSNELRFEDRRGNEEVYLHAQKDWNIQIEHDKGQQVLHDETLHVAHDRVMTVDHDVTETIGHDQTVAVGGMLTETVAQDAVLAVTGNRSLAVDHDHTEEIGGNQSIEVHGDKTESITGASTEHVTGARAVTLDDELTLSVSKNCSIRITKSSTEDVGENKALIVGKELAIQVGEALITVKQNGDITLEGRMLIVKGTGPILVEGQKLQVKSSGEVQVQASGNVKVKGGNVSVN